MEKWFDERAAALDLLAKAHAKFGEVEGRGRPLEKGRPVGQAYVMRLVAEFQGYVRDLLDLAAERLITATAPTERLEAILTRAITGGRSLDSGNPTPTALRTDFHRLGIREIEHKLAARYAQWDKDTGTDRKRLDALLALRNALAHGNARQLAELRRQGHSDTVSWGRKQLPVLTRAARGMDKVMWDHLKTTLEGPPW